MIMAEINTPFDEDFILQRDDVLGIGQDYIDSAVGQKPATLDDVCESLFMVEEAVHGLRETMSAQFDAHDYSLRNQVEKINSKTAWLLGTVALIGAAVLLWPRKDS